MTDNELSKSTLDFPKRQAEMTRTSSVGASVTKDEYRDIINALVQGGFESQSMGVRTVVLAYTLSAEVRDVVARAIRDLNLLAA